MFNIPVPASLRYIYPNFSTTSKPNHWPKARTSSIPVHGGNGSSGVKKTTILSVAITRTKTTLVPTQFIRRLPLEIRVEQKITRKFNIYRPRQDQSSVVAS
ncbi:hypothetical protein F444_09183 [Phytophthora nicotianae P1976]|uniref:Uncharacterized protein n=1 Tax=Phytophthora nicotianae P1976 TaxID=1317066 RepID=A0A081A8H8_PHYNI|nr:hypothetical protein F444_09183 [Phytophthora nicotianae P1976]